MPIYMMVPGIKGSVTAKGYEGCIALEGAEFEVEREMQQGVGRGRNRSWTAPSVGQVNCSKVVEDSSGRLFAWSLGAVEAKDSVFINFVKLGDDEWVEYMRWELQKVILSQYSQSIDDSPEEKGTEEFQLSYLKIFTEFDELKEDESLEKTTRQGYDIAKGNRI